MSIQLKNNASGTLSTAINASDVGAALTSGDGANFPALSGSDYFYATITNTDDTYEIVKVTARSGDSLTIVRAQEGTTARGFTAGALIETKVTAQSILDAIAYNSVSESDANEFTEIQTFENDVIVENGKEIKLYDSTNTHYHSLKNASNVLTLGYDGTGYATISSGGVVNFLASPTITGSYVYRAGGTDVPVTDGGTGASTAANARTNLGLSIGVDVQAYSAALASIAGLTTAADKMIYTTASNVYATADLPAFGRTLIANTTASDARSDLGLGTMATQAASSVAITGGTIAGVTDFSARAHVSSETSGTLSALSANSIVVMTGDVTIPAGVFSSNDIILFVAGASARVINDDTGMTLRLAGTSSTGDRSLAARGLGILYFNSASEATCGGNGMS